jgi:hypothetical protein
MNEFGQLRKQQIYECTEEIICGVGDKNKEIPKIVVFLVE